MTLAAGETGQGVAIKASARDLAVGATRIGQLDADATVNDALGLPLINGSSPRSDLAARRHRGRRRSTPPPTRSTRRGCSFSADARLAVGTLADLSGELDRLDDGFAVTLTRSACASRASPRPSPRRRP